MERIEIKVDETTAKKWRSASPEFKEIISIKFSTDVEFITRYYGNDEFLDALDEIGERLAERGLTEQTVNEILNSDD